MVQKAICIARRLFVAALILVIGAFDWSAYAQSDPLPSWNESAAKKAIIDFVSRITREGGPEFVAIPERIATFDNDGTLWTEKPNYFQLAFALDRIKAIAPRPPKRKTITSGCSAVRV